MLRNWSKSFCFRECETSLRVRGSSCVVTQKEKKWLIGSRSSLNYVPSYLVKTTHLGHVFSLHMLCLTACRKWTLECGLVAFHKLYHVIFWDWNLHISDKKLLEGLEKKNHSSIGICGAMSYVNLRYRRKFAIKAKLKQQPRNPRLPVNASLTEKWPKKTSLSHSHDSASVFN